LLRIQGRALELEAGTSAEAVVQGCTLSQHCRTEAAVAAVAGPVAEAAAAAEAEPVVEAVAVVVAGAGAGQVQQALLRQGVPTGMSWSRGSRSMSFRMMRLSSPPSKVAVDSRSQQAGPEAGLVAEPEAEPEAGSVAGSVAGFEAGQGQGRAWVRQGVPTETFL